MKLWKFEVVPNRMGIWQTRWFTARETAKAQRQHLIDTGQATVRPYPIGEYGDITGVESVEVELTPEGLVQFAREWANE